MAPGASLEISRYAKLLIMQNSVAKSFRFRMQIELGNKVGARPFLMARQLLLTFRRIFKGVFVNVIREERDDDDML